MVFEAPDNTKRKNLEIELRKAKKKLKQAKTAEDRARIGAQIEALQALASGYDYARERGSGFSEFDKKILSNI